MNGSAFRLLRENSGLALADVARMAGVGEAVVQGWDLGLDEAPEHITDAIENIVNQLDQLASKMLADLKELGMTAQDFDLPIKLLSYSNDSDLMHFEPSETPASASLHRALILRLCYMLSELWIESRIVYMDRKAYEKWLAGRPDSARMRNAWAKEQP